MQLPPCTSDGCSVCRCRNVSSRWVFFFLLQIFDEEYAVLYLDQGGALVAIRHTPLPIRHLWWVITTKLPFVTAWLIPSEGAGSLKLVKQKSKWVCLELGMSWFLLEEPAAVENDGSYSCHSISPLRVWSRNECGSHWSLLAAHWAESLSPAQNMK